HAEVDGHRGWLVAEHIALEARIAAARGVATDASVAEGQLPRLEARHRPHLDVVAVEVLLGDAVADHDDDVAVLEEEVGGLGRGVDGKQYEEGEEGRSDVCSPWRPAVFRGGSRCRNRCRMKPQALPHMPPIRTARPLTKSAVPLSNVKTKYAAPASSPNTRP